MRQYLRLSVLLHASVSAIFLCKCDTFHMKMWLQTKPAAAPFLSWLLEEHRNKRLSDITTCPKRLRSPSQTSARVAALPRCPVTLYHTSCYYLPVSPAAYSVVMSWHNINREPDCVGGSLLRRLALLCVASLPFQNHWMWELLEPSARLLNHYAISQQSKQSFLSFSPLRRRVESSSKLNELHVGFSFLHCLNDVYSVCIGVVQCPK